MMQRSSVAETLSEAELVRMSEVALELARVAQESGRLMLANIFRMAALEAAHVRPEIPSEAISVLRQPTTH
jgi:hypothetical protein